MSNFTDWLKRNHEDLYKQAMQTQTYLGVPANRTRMGFGTDTSQGIWFDTEFANVFTPYDQAHALWADAANRTPLITTTFFQAEAAFIPLYRKLYNGFLRDNPLVTDVDLQGMGLPQRPSGGRHLSPVATTHPDADVDTSELRRVGIHFYESDGTHKKAKPAGQHGAEARWGLFDHPQEVHLGMLTQSTFDTHTPLTLEFADEDRGKTLYFALRWENTRGEKGPFGPIMNAIVP
jgi:hypothetical protein